MSPSVKLGLIIIATVLLAGIAISLVRSLLGLLTPLAIVAGVGLILYGLINRKALGGGGRSLP